MTGGSWEVWLLPVDFEFGLALGGAVDAEGEVVDVAWDGAWWGAGLDCPASGWRGRGGRKESEDGEDRGG